MALSGRRILITGGASGIGRATAQLCLARGAQVTVLDRDPRTPEVARTLGCNGVLADVTDEAAVSRAVGQGASCMGGIDGLVNAAGIVASGPIERTDLRTWSEVLATNLTGPYIVSRAALRWLREAPRATIVNVSSGQGLLPGPNMGAYAASKGGLLAFGKSLAAELAPRIRVNAVCPGMVDTPMMQATHRDDDAATTRALMARYALGRIAEPRELAEAIVFLTSDASSFVTGSALTVDGGRCYH